ncbi:MAG: DUF192 domain-containing protein [SAR202 cluster bacterium]|nr:DUF192 domain-containing protein [SAR202 cluster bacterium]MDP6513430.1 DUF192 domain-containing protein [SAR202 cluster bacterium]MDP6714055.1 DUF192 domain-containing protein [SAR202 cluster bacterium]
MAHKRKRSWGVLSWRIGGRKLGVPIWAFALIVAIIGIAAGQAGSERVNALLAGFLLMPGESKTITVTNATDQIANALGVLVTDPGVEVDANPEFIVKADDVPLSDADQLLSAMLQGAGGLPAPPQTNKPPRPVPTAVPSPTPVPQEAPTAVPRPTPPPPLIEPADARLAIVSGKTFHVRVAADDYARSTGFRNKVAIFDDDAMMFIHPQEGHWSYDTRDIMIPLDILFLDRHFVIVDIQTTSVELVGTPDDELRIYRPSLPAMYVMQIKGGMSDAIGIAVGDHVAIR